MSITIEKYNQTELSGIELGQQQKYKTPPPTVGIRESVVDGGLARGRAGGVDSDNGSPIAKGEHYRKPVLKATHFFTAADCTHKSLNPLVYPSVVHRLGACRNWLNEGDNVLDDTKKWCHFAIK